MIFRFWVCLAVCFFAGALVSAQTTDVAAPQNSQQPPSAGEAQTPTNATEPSPPSTEDAYRAPAPPVDQNDSRGAMMELNDEHMIEVGDQLEYFVIEDREPPTVMLVDEDGKVELPLIGKFPAKGKTKRALALAVSEALQKDYYYQATVMINQHQPADRRGIVWVMGEVQRSGAVEIPSGDILRVTDAVMRAGGFTIFADPTRVVLSRPNKQDPANPQSFDINVGQILESGRLDQDMILRADDRIFVSRRGDSSGQYTISGPGITQSGVYPIAIGQKITISEAILLAGGFSQFGDGTDVKLIRYAEDGSKSEMLVNVEEILEEGKQANDVLLKSGDRIIVDEGWARIRF